MRDLREERPSWALTGAKGRDPNLISSIYLGADNLEMHNQKLQGKLALMEKAEVRYEAQFTEDAEIVIVAFGTAARVAQTAVKHLREEGLLVGLFRPVTLWPFPEKALFELSQKTKALFVVEMNAGQMLHDVRMVVGIDKPVKFLGRMGGVIPFPDEIERETRTLFEQIKTAEME